MPPRPHTLSRRALIGAAALTTAGCSFGSLDPDAEDPTYTPTSTPSESAAGPATTEPQPADPDAEVASQAAVELLTAQQVAKETAKAYPALADRLDPIARLHRAQAGELGGGQVTTVVVIEQGEPRAKVLRRIERSEQALQEHLVAAALAADSGALARLLASMAAATAQHRETL
ncbi:hypothetical protein [Nocardioides sp. GXZ039]|uniref:hypothetical protein n=1 Tax=Nocardioides sp. GXZ039 TaxID=3136018 RepID=UPI0030F46E30